MNLPTQTIPMTDHPAQKSLDMLDAGLFLAWNSRLERYEVWRRETGPRPIVSFIIRCSSEKGEYIDPSASWVMDQLRQRDGRHNTVEDAAEAALRGMREREAAEKAAQERALTDLSEEIALDNIPLWKRKSDPHYTTVDLKDWNPEPVHIPTAKS